MKVWYSIDSINKAGICLVRINYFVRTEEGTYQNFVGYRKGLNKKKWRLEYIFSYSYLQRNEYKSYYFSPAGFINEFPFFIIKEK